MGFLQSRNTEIRLLMRILAIIGAIVILLLLAGYIFIRVKAPHLLEFGNVEAEYRITVGLDSLEGAQFITGMNGCENILPEKDSTGVYVSCLDGYIHYLAPDQSGIFSISKSFKAGEAALGLAMSDNGEIFAAVCNTSLREWKTRGASVFQISGDLASMHRITEDFPSMNGICIDGEGNLYFTSSNFNVFNPEGSIYRMNHTNGDEFEPPEVLFQNVGLANGMYYDWFQGKIFFSNTLGGVFEFSPKDCIISEVYLKLRFMEACDDLCSDISGNIWMTDPGNSTVKMYNPGTGKLVRFLIAGIGQTSSCRIRSENGREMIYLSELKQRHNLRSTDFDGRGVFVVPAQSLLKLLEPLLIK